MNKLHTHLLIKEINKELQNLNETDLRQILQWILSYKKLFKTLNSHSIKK